MSDTPITAAEDPWPEPAPDPDDEPDEDWARQPDADTEGGR